MTWKYKILRLWPLWLFLSYLIVSLVYIHPGEVPLLERSTTSALSDGTDPVGMPYSFSYIIKHFKEAPAEYLFGVIHQPHTDAPGGMALWVSMGQRIAILFLSTFLPPEQLASGLVIIGMVLNGLLMFFFARALSIPKTVSWGMGLAWAINAFTRARAKVHMGMVGIYHLPLVFLGLVLVGKGGRRNTVFATLAFLTVAFMNQYYVVMLAVISPLLLYFGWTQKRAEEPALKFWTRLVACCLPGVLWLLSNLLVPMAPWVKFQGELYPQTGATTEKYHPFLKRFAARPMDYFTGDLGLGSRDLNPLRGMMSEYVERTGYDNSNPHERAEGIRWVLWILGSLAGLSLLPSLAKKWSREDQRLVLFLMALGAVSFLLSLAPGEIFDETGPSVWLAKIVPQMRVPNRSALGVAFALLIMSGLFLKTLLEKFPEKSGVHRLVSFTFIGLLLIELPPFYQSMPVSPILPEIQLLSHAPACGLGMAYPYVSNTRGLVEYYQFLQRMRGSECSFINANNPSSLNRLMIDNFAAQRVIPGLRESPVQVHDRLKSFATCASLSWIVFNPPLKLEQAMELCQSLGWKWEDEGVCAGPELNRTHPSSLISCLTP